MSGTSAVETLQILAWSLVGAALSSFDLGGLAVPGDVSGLSAVVAGVVVVAAWVDTEVL